MLQLEPIFKNLFISTTCASIPGRGIHFASKKLNEYLHSFPQETIYCLKLDIKKFYPSINRAILKKKLRKKIKDKDLLIELDKIIDSMDKVDFSKLPLTEEELAIYTRPGKGIPIGSYLSQYLANFYLNEFDHWIKEEKHIKFYLRYMDDIIILSDSKEKLHQLLKEIMKYLNEEMDLEVKSNYQVFLVDARGVDFVGYKHFRGYKLLRTKTLKKIKKNVQIAQEKKMKINDKDYHAIISNIGQLSWCNSNNFYEKYFYEILPYINAYYKLHYQGKHRKIIKGIYNYYAPLKNRELIHHGYSHKKIHNRRKRNESTRNSRS